MSKQPDGDVLTSQYLGESEAYEFAPQFEDYEVSIYGEWGDCRSMTAMEKQGDLPQDYC